MKISSIFIADSILIKYRKKLIYNKNICILQAWHLPFITYKVQLFQNTPAPPQKKNNNLSPLEITTKYMYI